MRQSEGVGRTTWRGFRAGVNRNRLNGLGAVQNRMDRSQAIRWAHLDYRPPRAALWSQTEGAGDESRHRNSAYRSRLPADGKRDE